MRIIDPGHKYLFDALDGEHDQILDFVKRDNPPEKYPGNVGHHPGTTVQEVLRGCIDRLSYVNNQIPCGETIRAREYLKFAIWELECRNAGHKGRILKASPQQVVDAPICSKCFHIECEEHK